MKRTTIALTLSILLTCGATAIAASSHGGHGAGGHAADSGGTFTHQAVVEGTRAEFQIMSLASMNMTDPAGATHHIMVKFNAADGDQPVTDAVGKIKVIAPSGQSQEAALKNYSGVLAANVTFDAPGRYGVICLFVDKGQKRVVKFWYPHQQ